MGTQCILEAFNRFSTQLYTTPLLHVGGIQVYSSMMEIQYE